MRYICHDCGAMIEDSGRRNRPEVLAMSCDQCMGAMEREDIAIGITIMAKYRRRE